MVRAAWAQGQRYHERIVALIVGTYNGDSDADVSARQKLLGPIMEQNQKISSAMRRRRDAAPCPR